MQEEYLQGKENWFIRMWFYLQRGLGVIEKFKTPGAAIIALYAVLKLTNPMWMVWVTLAIFPPLIIIGHYDVHRMSKVTEWLSTKFSTHYGIKTFELNQETVKILGEIKQILSLWKKN